MPVDQLKHSEQELLNLSAQAIPMGAKYTGAQTNTVVITPSGSTSVVCVIGMVVSIDADGTFSLNDNSTSPVTVYPTTTVKAGIPLVITGLTIYRGVAGKNVRLTSSGSISVMLWYYEDTEDTAAPV
jgi:hypothetical protein